MDAGCGERGHGGRLATPGVREIFGCMPEYWETGKPRLEADVRATCEGLVAGGASELVVLDNHGGNTVNVAATPLPAGARLETWNVYELPEHGVDAMFQVGYHPRGGVDGFLSHVPGLRLRVDGELMSESHGRAWAAEVPLLGIVGNDLHQRMLGSLEGTPYLVVQESVRKCRASVHGGWPASRALRAASTPRLSSSPVSIGSKQRRSSVAFAAVYEPDGLLTRSAWVRILRRPRLSAWRREIGVIGPGMHASSYRTRALEQIWRGRLDRERVKRDQL